MERVCFLGRVRPDRLSEYRLRHAEVWPEMTAALREAGWTNYSLFVDDDGLLVGYLETDDYEAAQKRMAETGVNARWQAEMQPFSLTSAACGPTKGSADCRRSFTWTRTAAWR